MEAIQYGLGPVGCTIVRLGFKRGLRYIGAVDCDPGKAGRDLGLAVGLGRELGVPVTEKAEDLLARAGGVVVTHATGSLLKQVLPQLIELLAAGCTVVSTCEELSYPFWAHPEEAAVLDEAAKKHRGRLLGTGVNPGFIMDFLPLCLTLASQEVASVKVERVVDAAGRREPLQKKVGAGLSREEFVRGVESGAIRHVGLPESVAMLAAGLGWPLEKIDEEIEPVISSRRLSTGYVTVEPGGVAGVHQVARGYVNGGGARIVLDLKMAVGEAGVDRITVEGQPPLTLEVTGGVHGDLATASVIVNSIAALASLPPGLHTMLDLARARYGLLAP
ncbi:MAG: dihydrodipicolinate reductase [Bacillota bacterium]